MSQIMTLNISSYVNRYVIHEITDSSFVVTFQNCLNQRRFGYCCKVRTWIAFVDAIKKFKLEVACK